MSRKQPLPPRETDKEAFDRLLDEWYPKQSRRVRGEFRAAWTLWFGYFNEGRPVGTLRDFIVEIRTNGAEGANGRFKQRYAGFPTPKGDDSRFTPQQLHARSLRSAALIDGIERFVACDTTPQGREAAHRARQHLDRLHALDWRNGEVP